MDVLCTCLQHISCNVCINICTVCMYMNIFIYMYVCTMYVHVCMYVCMYVLCIKEYFIYFSKRYNIMHFQVILVYNIQ